MQVPALPRMRRGGGRGGEPFAQKFSQVAQISVEKKGGSYDAWVNGWMMHRSTYEVKTFLPMNLSYELIKHVKRKSCLCHFDGYEVDSTSFPEFFSRPSYPWWRKVLGTGHLASLRENDSVKLKVGMKILVAGE